LNLHVTSPAKILDFFPCRFHDTSRPSLQKPEALTAFGRSYYNNNIYLVIKDLTPVIDGQLILAESGQG
jgi:hypothetical protein